MIPAQELWLVVAAFALYAGDATRLLYADEFVLELRGRRWHAGDGLQALVGGRRPLVPSLLAPGRCLLLVSVDRLGGVDRASPDDGRHFLAALRPLGWRSTLLWLLFFPGLPLVLRMFGTGVELIAWLLAVYGLIGTMALYAWRCRRVLGLDRRAVAMLALECALCPPFAINLARRVGLRGDRLDLGTARRVLGANGRAVLLEAASRRIDDMLGYVAEDSPRAASLLARRSQLQARTP